MLSTKGNRSFNKRLYQHAAKAWLVYLLNELERFSKHSPASKIK